MKKSLIAGMTLFAAFLGQLPHAHAQSSDDTIIQGPFSVNNMVQNGKIYFTKDEADDADPDSCHSIQFMLEYKKDGRREEATIDQYESDPFCPELTSVFFQRIHRKPYVFTLVKRHINIESENTDADEYTITAYTRNKQGTLSKDDAISNNPFLSGNNGVFHGKQVSFHYKTAADIKNYLKKKYH